MSISNSNLNKLINWSLENHSELPWRIKRTFYTTLVSEIMLQQTTVGTVLKHFDRFLVTYPSLKKLANSNEEDMRIAWKGLGYYRRAANLLKAANDISSRGGYLKINPNDFETIPGVGPYTASALRAIGLDLEDLAVDGNIERVISRLICSPFEKGPKNQKYLRDQFSEGKLWKKGKFSYRELNEALMDLGRVICRPKKPLCNECVLKFDCEAYQSQSIEKFPIQTVKRAPLFYLKLARLIIKNRKQEILVYKKDAKEWLTGQYEVPTIILESEDEKLNQYPHVKNASKTLNKSDGLYKTSITKYKIENSIHKISQKDFSNFFEKLFQNRNFTWVKSSRDSDLSTSTLKALNCIDLIN